MEQIRADAGLEAGDRLGHGGLGQADIPSRSGEGAGIRDLAKMAQASKSGRRMTGAILDTLSFQCFYFQHWRQAPSSSPTRTAGNRNGPGSDAQGATIMAEAGIHHVTAFAGPAARNREFYTRTLGLRLVKTTVNFDDPGTYHLYYGDEAGTPGTIVTFFPIEQAGPGRAGIGETSETAFRVAKASLGYWTKRFAEERIAYEPLVKVFGESVLRFKDPDG